MKRNPISLITGGLLLVIFVLMLFSFQVRTTEVAVVTRFGRAVETKTEPGWYARAPWPIHKIYKFDNRIQNFETKYEQTSTKDAINVLVSVYAGWRVADAKVFLESFNGDILRAEQELDPVIRNIKNGVIGTHPFSALVSTNAADLKFDEIEKEMLAASLSQASKRGIKVELLNIKQIGLPESITTKVFDRMRAERQRLVRKYQSDGEKEASIIRATAESETNRVLTYAASEATKIRGEGEREAAKSYAVFKQNPDFAMFLFRLRSLEASLKDKSTLILDQQSAPFNLLNGSGTSK